MILISRMTLSNLKYFSSIKTLKVALADYFFLQCLYFVYSRIDTVTNQVILSESAYKTSPGLCISEISWRCLWRVEDVFELPPKRNLAPCFPAGVPVHAAVRSVCDPQPGRLNALLSECTDGQVYAHLPGKLHYASAVFCSLTLRPCFRECVRNSF